MSSLQRVPAEPNTRVKRDVHRISVIITLGALLVVAVRLVWPQLTIDAITLSLIALAIVPWLGHVFSEIEVGGNGVKVAYRDFQELKAEVETQGKLLSENSGRSESALTQAELATSVIRSFQPSVAEAQARGAVTPQVSDLVDEYDNIRSTIKKGTQRTALMTDVVGRMIGLVPDTSIDLGEALRAKGGKRLAAYARLYAVPDPAFLDSLISSVGESKPGNPKDFLAQPFEQYWGIQAIRMTLSQMNVSEVSASAREQLIRLSQLLPPGSDRHYEISRVLELLGVS